MKRIWLLASVALFVVSPAAAGVRVIADVDYVADADYGGKDRLDIYAPDGAKRSPVIVSFHGGALSEGDRKPHAFVGRRFASAGFVTVIPSYRLSPAVSHPAHVQDAAAAVAWVKRHIGEYGGDPDRIFVIGHSAGAYLAALLATDPRFLAAHNLTPKDIAGVVPVSAFYWVERKGVAPDRPKHVWGTEEAVWKSASPARYLDGPVPPMLIVYADGDEDWRRKQNDEMGAALKAAGHRDVAVHQVANRNHNTVWSRMEDGGSEETSSLILSFVSRLASAGTMR